MIGEKIRNLRKTKNMSQDELAEKLDVTRQSISLWENDQTQPSLENIVALAKIFGITTDELLTEEKTASAETTNEAPAEKIGETPKKKSKKGIVIAGICVACAAAAIIALTAGKGKPEDTPEDAVKTASSYVQQEEAEPSQSEEKEPENQPGQSEQTPKTPEENQPAPTEEKPAQTEQKPTAVQPEAPKKSEVQPVTPENQPQPTYVEEKPEQTAAPTQETPKKKDLSGLYEYLKNFTIEKGKLNGDYCYYGNTADVYGGSYDDDFDIYYWADTEVIEFSLHTVLDDTFSICYYLRIPKNFSGIYDYIVSLYYRTDGTPELEAKGTIDPAVFTQNYPLNCSKYTGSDSLQNDFMETSRLGMVQVLKCLKTFTEVEKLDYSFTDLGFTKF